MSDQGNSVRGNVVVKAQPYRRVQEPMNWNDFFMNLPKPSNRASPWGLLSL
jgi:hypothetical protein